MTSSSFPAGAYSCAISSSMNSGGAGIRVIRSVLITAISANGIELRARLSCFGGFRSWLSCRRFLNQAPANHQTLNLVRAFVNLRDLGIAHVFLNRIIFAITVAAEELHGIGRH